MRKKLILEIVLLAIIIFIFFSVFASRVFYPAYLSYKIACDKDFFERNKYLIGASFDHKEQTITIYQCENQTDMEMSRLLKHEFIHSYQQDKDRLYSCEKPTGVFFNEIEAYIGENLPNKIFIYIYEPYEVQSSIRNYLNK